MNSDSSGPLKPTGLHARHTLNIHSEHINKTPTMRVHTATSQTVPNLKQLENFPLKPKSLHGLTPHWTPRAQEARTQRGQVPESKSELWSGQSKDSD